MRIGHGQASSLVGRPLPERLEGYSRVTVAHGARKRGSAGCVRPVVRGLAVAGRYHALLTVGSAIHQVGESVASLADAPLTSRAVGRLVSALDAFLVAHRATDALRGQSSWLEPVR